MGLDMQNKCCLVVLTPWKNMSSSDWIIIPTIGENKKCSKPPTRLGISSTFFLDLYVLICLDVRFFWKRMLAKKCRAQNSSYTGIQ
jgi:hypothetical protein